MATPADPAVLAYAKVHTFSDRLFDALELLEDAGGLPRAAVAAGWTPKAIRGVEATLLAARDAIDRQLAELGQVEAARKPRPAPDRRIISTEASPASAPLARRIRSKATI